MIEEEYPALRRKEVCLGEFADDSDNRMPYLLTKSSDDSFQVRSIGRSFMCERRCCAYWMEHTRASRLNTVALLLFSVIFFLFFFGFYFPASNSGTNNTLGGPLRYASLLYASSVQSF